MLYTSYFGNIKKLEENGLVPIAICGGVPEWWGTRPWYKKLAPKWKFFSEWKENHDNLFYIKHFQEEVLSKLNPEQVYHDLYTLASETMNFAMICYEKPREFCHRHLVADWLTKRGFTTKEWCDFNEF